MDPERRIEGVSAVVCTFDGEAHLEECLRSVLAQPGLDELIVVDNGSTDGSAVLVRERFPTARLLVLPENRGPCVARNEGMRVAAHPFVLAVDVDVVLEPDVLPRLRAALEARPGAVAAQPRSVLATDPGRVHYDGGELHYVGLFALRNFYAPREGAVGDEVAEVGGLVALCALLDREAVLALGGYDERFFYLAEDLDLSLRLRLAGHALLSVSTAIVRHKGGTAGLSFRGGAYPRRRTFLHARNRWLVLAKGYRVRTLLAFAGGLVVYEAAWVLFALARGQLGAHLAGKLSFLRHLPGTLRDRRAVQATRRRKDRELFVGGPLTLSPSLVERPAARRLAALLDRVLRAWWVLARPLAG